MEDAKIQKLISQNALLEQQVDILKQIISIINTTHKLDNILKYILELCKVITTSEAGFILIKEEMNSDFLTFKTVIGPKGKELIGQKWEVGKGIIGEVYCSGKERLVNDVRKDESFRSEISSLLGVDIKSSLVVPLNTDGKILGAMELVNKKGGLQFNEDDLFITKLIAEQLASIVNNTISFHSVESKISRFNSLINVSIEINSINDLHKLLETIMKSAKNVMKAEASSCMLYDEEKNELVFDVALGEVGEKLKTIRVPVGEKSISGWVALKRKPLLIPDAYEDPRFNPDYDKKTGFRTRSVLCVPLEYKNKLKGVIQILNAIGKDSFEEEDIEYLTALANQASVAIENAKLIRDIKELFLSVVKSIVKIIDSSDKFMEGHSLRVTKYALAIAKQLELPPDMLEKIQIASLLHDIGRLSIPQRIWHKPGQLTEEEYAIVKKHPEYSATILTGIKMLDHVVPAIQYHHEHFNGKGYPKGLQGNQIPLISRIIAVADAYDAMTSPRPYRPAYQPLQAKGRIAMVSGTQFDSLIVQAFSKAWDAKQI